MKIFNLNNHLISELLALPISGQEARALQQQICDTLAQFDSMSTPNGNQFSTNHAPANAECWRMSHFITDTLQASGNHEFETYTAASNFAYNIAVNGIERDSVIIINDTEYHPK